jgi:WD40 repeat protein
VAARFDAFISYSRSASSTLAVALRNGIERFAKPWYRLRSSRVFLDDASMSANTGLWSTIERGLTEAEWFLLLCSPKSAASQYVTNEITWWLEHKSAERMLLVLDEGEILWDAKVGDFDWARATAVNPALTKAFAEEPRWVDLSWFELEDSLRDADPRFPERIADLAAAIRFQERDELVGENVRERRRALRLLRGGVIALSGLLVASLVATVIAVVNGNAAAEQARIALARQLAAQAITLSSTDLQTASLLAVEAQRMNDDAQTRAALFQLATASPALVRSVSSGARVEATAISADGTVFTADADGAVVRWDGAERVDLADLNAPAYSITVSDDGGYVAVAARDDTVRVVTPDGDIEVSVAAPDDQQSATLAALSPDGEYLAVTDRNTWLTLLVRGTTGGEVLYTPVGTVPHGGRVGFGDGELTTFDQSGDWARISLADASVIASGFHILGAQSNGGALSADGRVMAGSLAKSVNYSVWDSVGSVSQGGTVEGDPPDRVTTTQVAGALDKALDEHGTRFAAMIDGAVYVSEVRGTGELPQTPIALLGAGEVNEETLSFRGDTLVSGTGDFALVWDLAQAGRIATDFEAPVPEGCGACGPQRMRVDADGTQVVMTAVGGDGPVVVDLESGTSRAVDPEGSLGIGAAAWWDADRIVVASAAENALIVASPDLSTAEQVLRLPFADGQSVVDIRADAGGRVTVLADDGSLAVLDARSGDLVTQNTAFADLLERGSPLSFAISPDQRTAFMYVTDVEGGLRMVDVATGATLFETGDAVGAAYDGAAPDGAAPDGAASGGASRLHVFLPGRQTVRASDGSEIASGIADVEDVPLPVVSARGDLVVSGGTGGAMSLLDLDRGGAVFGRIPVPVEENRLPVAVFTPGGEALVTSIPSMASLGRPATVSRLTLVPSDWRESACAVAGRDLSAEEWATWVGTEPPADLGCDR